MLISQVVRSYRSRPKNDYMYVKTKCPTCGEPVCLDLLISEKVSLHSTEIIDVQVLDTCTASELARGVISELAAHVYDGITKAELCRILKDKFRILERYCCDIIQQLKIELGLYCKDGIHLKYIP